MTKIRFVLSLLILIFSFVFATALMTRVALAQCTWMKGLTVVQVFNNVHDYGWVGSWDPCLDSTWMAHSCCPLARSCAFSTHSAYASNDPPDPVSNERPAVNHAVASDTCPSAHDIDCDCHPVCSTGCPGSACAPGG